MKKPITSLPLDWWEVSVEITRISSIGLLCKHSTVGGADGDSVCRLQFRSSSPDIGTKQRLAIDAALEVSTDAGEPIFSVFLSGEIRQRGPKSNGHTTTGTGSLLWESIGEGGVELMMFPA